MSSREVERSTNMVRSYMRKTTRGDYGEENIQAAVAAVKSKTLHFTEASTRYHVPVLTIAKRIRLNQDMVQNLGRFKPVFTHEQEIELVEHAITIAKLFHGFSSASLRKLAYYYAVMKEISHPFNETRKMSGEDWEICFRHRHPELTLRSADATSLNRIFGFTKEKVEKLYNNLQAIRERYAIPPRTMLQMDETEYSSNS